MVRPLRSVRALLVISLASVPLAAGAQFGPIERERDEFFERVRAGFLQRAAKHPRRIRVLDASPSAEQVASAALVALAAYRKDLP